MRKLLLYIFFSCLVVACNRKVALHKTTTTDKSVEVHKSNDSSFTTTVTDSKQYYDFGDTLQGSWLTVDSVTVDSAESSGVKILTTVARQKNGTVKTTIKAIAKPKQVVNVKHDSIYTRKQIATVDSIKKDLVVTTKDKEIESSNSTFFMFASLLFMLAIVLLIIYIIGQYKGKW